MSTTYKNILATVLGLALVFALAFTVTSKASAAALSQSQVDAIINLLVSFGADQATINNVRAALTGQPANNGGSNNQGNQNSGSCTPMVFTMNHKMGDRGGEVRNIQKFLNSNGFTVATTGPGSAGNETDYFGPATKAAVKRFQEAYASEILSPVGLTRGTGYWGNSTRAKANAIEQARCAQANQNQNQNNNNNNQGNNDQDNQDNQDNQQSDKLVVSAAAQPADSLAPEGATNVPFTRFTLTGDATVDEVKVKLQGLANRQAFSSVAILDENGKPVTRYKSLDSNGEVTFTRDFTNSGTKTYTVVANVKDANGAYAGQVASFAVVSIKANKDVDGTFPISGAQHTINSTLSIGELSFGNITSDSTLEVGDENRKIAEFDISASNEDVKIMKVALKDTSSNTADFSKAFANVKAEFNGNSYPVSVSRDQMIVDFIPAITLQDGDTETLTITADVVGESNEDYAVQIDDDNTKAKGASYGYGAKLTPGNALSAVTIGGAELTIEPDSAFSSPETANPGDRGVVLAQFEVTNTTGSDITADSFSFDVTFAEGSGNDVNSADANIDVSVYRGATRVAGPETTNFALTSGSTGETKTYTVTYSDFVFAPGANVVYTVKADLDKDLPNGSSYKVNNFVVNDPQDENGDNVSQSIDSVFSGASSAGHQVNITTGEFTARLKPGTVNDDKAVKTSTSGVTLATYEWEAKKADVVVDEVTVVFDDTNANTTAITGDVELWIDGTKVATATPTDTNSNSRVDTVTFTNLNREIAKDSRATVEVKANARSTAGDVVVAAMNDFVFETDPAASTLTNAEVTAQDVNITANNYGASVTVVIDNNQTAGTCSVTAATTGTDNITVACEGTATTDTLATTINSEAKFSATGGSAQTTVVAGVYKATKNADFDNTDVTTKVVSALPVIREQDVPAITMTSSSASGQKVLEFSIKADGDDVTVDKVHINATGDLDGSSGASVGISNVEVQVYSDAAKNNLVKTIEGAVVEKVVATYSGTVTGNGSVTLDNVANTQISVNVDNDTTTAIPTTAAEIAAAVRDAINNDNTSKYVAVLDSTGTNVILWAKTYGNKTNVVAGASATATGITVGANVTDPNIFTVNEVISDGDTYYFVVLADLHASSGGSVDIFITDADNSITFSAPAELTGSFDESVLIEDDMKTTVNTAL